jgi:hypothetical protein
MSDFMQGLGDFVTVGIGDVGNSYQEILMADASISTPDALPVDYETTTTTVDYPAPEAAALEPYEPPSNDPIPGLDIG